MELGAGAYAAAGAATAGGVAAGLFGYNRGNYMMDQKLHFSRFTAGFGLASAQTEMYKEDLADLTALTANRMHVYADIAGMTATILTAIFCPGRVGLHTPPPPGWHMGLMMVNVGGAYIYLGLTMWLALHAALRANAATTHMSTRFVRLPTPAQWMIDRARKFLSSYEEQPFREVFRIPFLARHKGGKDNPGGFNEALEMDPDAQRRTRHGYDVPAWYRAEKKIDQGEAFESMMPLHAAGTAPEHFEVYREIQNEWWPYDVYARLSIFLAFMHLTHCWVYEHLGHMFCETRAVLGAGCIAIPIFVLQQIILTLDIAPSAVDIPLQRLGPCAILVAWFALCIEYQPYYDPSVAVIGYLLVYVAYAFHIIYTIQLLRICAPDYSDAPEQAEVPAGSWWPNAWRLPKAFQHACWLVAPPRHLEPGQNDLVGEMRKAAEGGQPDFGGGRLTADPAEGKRRDVHKALGKQGESPAWFNVRTGLIGMLIAWIYLTFGFTIEIINAHTDHPSMLNAFGLPNNLRDPRYRPPKAGYSMPTEVGTGGIEHGPMMGSVHHRRLSEVEGKSTTHLLAAIPRHELVDKLRDVLPYLRDLAQGKTPLGGSQTLPAMASMVSEMSSPLSGGVARAALRWPALFEPRLLACGHSAAHSAGKVAVALSQHGRGAIISTQATHVGAEEIPAETESFSLEGAADFGPLLTASWDELGLMLLSATGVTLECPGAGPTEGLWRCQSTLPAKLPVERGVTVALTRLPKVISQGKEVSPLRAAVAYPGESSVTTFAHSGHHADSWLPIGEVRTRTHATSAAFTATAKDLLLASSDGAVARLRMGDGSVEAASRSLPHGGLHWQATCSLASGGVARLALSQEPGSREPAFFLGA
eukprot:TRINITY_DN6189_c0_g1_i2.p1 TRINITY_DN6189_c0_g1~~TRINITY_DN6189_c0_g1_i2.p1  ORF type:complete len:871 (-),score=125.31 TRINITY_DN6189_c0_g1_i2:135-2747(-)